MIFNKGSVTLETERLILRKLKFQDSYTMFNTWANDDEVSKYLTWETHKSTKDTKEYLQLVTKKYQENDFYNWGIELKNQSQLIGTISAHNIDEENLSIEVGYCIGRKFWNKGYVTEALKREIEFLFEEVNINRIIGTHIKENLVSGIVMQKAGLKYEGLLRQALMNKHKLWDIKIYAILKEDYSNLT